MRKVVHRFSIVYLSCGEDTEIYPSKDSIPPDARRKLLQMARQSKVETIVIANEQGREALSEWRTQTAPAQPSVAVEPFWMDRKFWKWIILGVVVSALGALTVLAFRFQEIAR
ncbi:MAG: hypothetical protein HYZ37_17090 [Candidatus Solibacter usitatus]|nr:hypothetical protein [Candidatus Solibacter usitatus]